MGVIERAIAAIATSVRARAAAASRGPGTAVRPTWLRRAPARRAVVATLAATLVITPLGAPVGMPGPATVRAAAICTGWANDSAPPTTIRVLRTAGSAAGTVQVVKFHAYVNVVMAAEWGPGNPAEALKAGAVAVKQYAWYHTMFWRGGSSADGACYDVVDSSRDQVYAPETRVPSPSHVAAVDATWGISMRKTQGLFAAHYDAGASVPCGANANGWQLFQVSATHCAQDGMLVAAILETYYRPGVQIVGAPPVPTSATALSFRALPSEGAAGVPFPVQPVVAIIDGAGQTVTTGASSTAAVTLTLAPSPSGALLTCTGGLSRAAVAGLAVFEGCQVNAADPGAVLVASATGLPSVSSPPVPVAPAPIATGPAPLMTLGAAGTPTLWGMDVRLTAELVPTGGEAASGRTLHLQRSSDGVAWTTATDLTTGTTGAAGILERPAANITYRVVFDGAPDLAAATSPAVPVVVPRVALLRPDSRGVVRRVARGAGVAFSTLVRPMQGSVRGRVEYRLVLRVGRTWVVKRSWTVGVDATGWARLRVTFASSGSWGVQVRALATPTNGTSGWSLAQRYDVS